MSNHPLRVQSFDEWRTAVRALLAQGIAPHDVHWSEPGRGNGDLPGIASPEFISGGSESSDPFDAAPTGLSRQVARFAPSDATACSGLSKAPPAFDRASPIAQADPSERSKVSPALRVPRELMQMLHTASCYRSPDRWAFLYKIVWRWQRGEKEVLSAADEDGSHLHAMVKAVGRELHDMHAYVRFRERSPGGGDAMGPCPKPDPASAPDTDATPGFQPHPQPHPQPSSDTDSPSEPQTGPRFVAWYEPAHDILPQAGRHFAARMGKVPWMIATPEATMAWDGETLRITDPLVHGPEEIEDAGESLWLTYYRSIFNPSRVNERLLQQHIPSRYWKNLPEGRLVPGMVAEAAAGARRVGQAGTVGRRSGTIIPIAAERAQPHRAAPASLDQCRRCDLWERATQAVGGTGSQEARIMLVGEQPGDQEDLEGRPMVGPAGQLLDQALSRAALARDSIYLTNAVKHFGWEPRGKRRLHKTPGQREIAACRHWLEEELARIRPEVVVARQYGAEIHLGNKRRPPVRPAGKTLHAGWPLDRCHLPSRLCTEGERSGCSATRTGHHG